MTLTTHSTLEPKLKEEYDCVSTPPVGLLGLFWGEIYLIFCYVLSNIGVRIYITWD
jgi:hypothetical protein